MRAKPKMILFDYGHTLCCEPDFSWERGNAALFSYIKTNPDNITPDDIKRLTGRISGEIDAIRRSPFETFEKLLMRFLFEYHGIEFTVPLEEAERIYRDAISAGDIMPYADEMLDYINANGIRSGVISNNCWSGGALAGRINRLLPNNRFEFVIASSEYIFRKPSPLIFELAMKKARLPARDIWYCGDNIWADAEGSAAAGMFPVWYEDNTTENPWSSHKEGEAPACGHLHIHHWKELITALENCE